MNEVTVEGAFDDLGSRDMRYLQEAARRGDLRVTLWSDEVVRQKTGVGPKFPEEERRYLLESLRFVNCVEIADKPIELDDVFGSRTEIDASIFPSPIEDNRNNAQTGHKVIVTGCYDWLHSGHVRFFEESSKLGDLYVVVGSDANVRLLKGEGHPLFSEEERRYQVRCIRYVHEALISTGTGWMDSAPEIKRINPDFYVVNEDGDRPEKRDFCAENGLKYVVLKREPKTGLPQRESTFLRGF
jgi:cytidyltransferase-like protein